MTVGKPNVTAVLFMAGELSNIQLKDGNGKAATFAPSMLMVILSAPLNTLTVVKFTNVTGPKLYTQ